MICSKKIKVMSMLNSIKIKSVKGKLVVKNKIITMPEQLLLQHLLFGSSNTNVFIHSKIVQDSFACCVKVRPQMSSNCA